MRCSQPRLFWYLSASPQFARKNSSFRQKLKSTQSFITFLRNIDEDDDVGDKELRRSVQVDSDRAIPLLLANFAHHPQKGPIARGAWKELFLGALNIPPSNCPYLQTNFIYWVSYASLYFENWKVEWHVLWLLIDHKTCLDTWMSLNSLARSKENVSCPKKCIVPKEMYGIQRKCIVSKENIFYQKKISNFWNRLLWYIDLGRQYQVVVQVVSWFLVGSMVFQRSFMVLVGLHGLKTPQNCILARRPSLSFALPCLWPSSSNAWCPP